MIQSRPRISSRLIMHCRMQWPKTQDNRSSHSTRSELLQYQTSKTHHGVQGYWCFWNALGHQCDLSWHWQEPFSIPRNDCCVAFTNVSMDCFCVSTFAPATSTRNSLSATAASRKPLATS